MHQVPLLPGLSFDSIDSAVLVLKFLRLPRAFPIFKVKLVSFAKSLAPILTSRTSQPRAQHIISAATAASFYRTFLFGGYVTPLRSVHAAFRYRHLKEPQEDRQAFQIGMEGFYDRQGKQEINLYLI